MFQKSISLDLPEVLTTLHQSNVPNQTSLIDDVGVAPIGEYTRIPAQWLERERERERTLSVFAVGPKKADV